MFWEYLQVIAQGIPTSLLLTVVSLSIAFLLAILFTFLLSMENKAAKKCGQFISYFIHRYAVVSPVFLNLCRAGAIPMGGG